MKSNELTRIAVCNKIWGGTRGIIVAIYNVVYQAQVLKTDCRELQTDFIPIIFEIFG
jgi:hypothetical protein